MGMFDSFFGTSDPSKGVGKILGQIPGAISGYYQPYIAAGQGALPQLQQQYGNLLNNPGQMVNNIGSNYHQSPGFQFALQQALQGSGHAAAAGGMAGSPEHEQMNEQMATGMADQDYNQWLQNAMGMYGQGLSGEQGLASGGLTAGNAMAQQVAQELAAQAQLKYAGQASQNQQTGGLWGGLAGAAGTILGGPVGGAAANWMFGK